MSFLEVLGYGALIIGAAAFWIWWGERKEKKQAEKTFASEQLRELQEQLKDLDKKIKKEKK